MVPEREQTQPVRLMFAVPRVGPMQGPRFGTLSFYGFTVMASPTFFVVLDGPMALPVLSFSHTIFDHRFIQAGQQPDAE